MASRLRTPARRPVANRPGRRPQTTAVLFSRRHHDREASVAVRLPQGRHRGPRARARRARVRDPLDRRHGGRARGGGRAGDQRLEGHRLSRDPRRTGEDPAPEDPRRHPRPARRAHAHGGARGARDPDDRRRRGEPLSIRGEGREGLLVRRGRRERRRRRAEHGPGGGQELPARGRRGRPRGLRAAARAARPARRHRRGDASLLRPEGLPPHRPLRRRDRRLLRPGRGARRQLRSSRDGRDVPLSPEPHVREGPGPALRREPAPAGRVLQRPRLDPLLGGGRAQAAGEGAFLQQHPRPRRRLAPGDRARGAGLRDRQAHEPLRHGARRRTARGLRARVVLRPDLGLRRHHRLQRAARRGDREEDERAVRRGGDRTRVREGGARRAREEGRTCA